MRGRLGQLVALASVALAATVAVSCSRRAEQVSAQYAALAGSDGRLWLTLTRAVLTGKTPAFCFAYRDVVFPYSGSTKAWFDNLSAKAVSAAREWLSKDPRTAAVDIQTTALDASGKCPEADMQNGRMNVFLYDSEQAFLSAIRANSTEKVVGEFNPTKQALLINVEGVRTRQASTQGMPTLRHEIGHAFGLNHENSAPSVMAPALSVYISKNFTPTISNDDAAGFRSIVDRTLAEMRADGVAPVLPGSQANPVPVATNTPAPVTSQQGPNPGSCAEPASPLVAEFNDTAAKERVLKVDAANGTFFKRNEGQGKDLRPECKCPIANGTALRVRVGGEGWPTTGHVAVKLAEAIPGCSFGTAGALGVLYAPHWP